MFLQSRIKMSHKPKFIGFMGHFFDSMLQFYHLTRLKVDFQIGNFPI